MKLIWCSGFAEIYAQLEEGVRSVCHEYMCLLLYMKLTRCNGFPEIYAQLEEGGQSTMGICAFWYIWNSFGVVVFQRSMLNWRREHEVNLPWVYVHSAIYETYFMQLCCIDLWSFWGGVGVSLPMGICAFCYIWNLCGVVMLHRSVVILRRGWSQSAMDVCAFCYIWNLFYVVVLHRSVVILRRGWSQSAMGICAFCYIWNLFHVLVLHRSVVILRRGWSQSAMGICAFCYIWNLFHVVVLHRSVVILRKGWSQSAMDVCAFCYIWNLFGVVVLQRSMLNWRREHEVNLPWVYVHSAIYETYFM